jgi:HEAT repeat protein
MMNEDYEEYEDYQDDENNEAADIDEIDEIDNIPFAEVLDALLGVEPVHIPLLFRLSDLTDEEMALFTARWVTVADERRRVIVRHLADIVEENFLVDFSPIFQLGLRDSYAAVRVAALDGLWDMEDVLLIPPLLEMMKSDRDIDVRVGAAGVLGQFVVLVEWEQAPRAFGERIVTEMLNLYDAPDTAVQLRRALLEGVAAANHARVPQLIRTAYDSDDEQMQVSAMFAMGNNADRQWLPYVLQEMRSENDLMRLYAARAAGLVGSSDALELLEELTADEDDEVCLQAIMSLGQIGGDLAEEILRRLADDPDYDEFAEALEDALDELAMFAGQFDFLDYDPDEVDDEDDEDYEDDEDDEFEEDESLM